MRDLAKSDRNKVVVTDKLSGTDICIYYRNPTTAERVEFRRRLIKRNGRKIIDCSAETALDMGLRIITGFEPGDFGMDGKPISSDPAHENYYPDWKRLLQEEASDIVTVVAGVVFNGVSAGESDIEFLDSDSEGGEEALPL